MALVLLILAALLYVFAIAMHQHSIAFAYLAAFSEAAMVGALADWFAVVALFRKPLGLPIPHTAVIVNNQQRIAKGVANFIDHNFLDETFLRQRLKSLDIASWLASWLQNSKNTNSVTAPLVNALLLSVSALDDSATRSLAARNIIKALRQVDLSDLIAMLLNNAMINHKHQVLLDEVLIMLGSQLKNDSVRDQISEAIALELASLRFFALDKAAARLATRKLIAAVARLLNEMAQQPDHPMRLRFDETMHKWIEHLHTDTQLRHRMQEFRDEWLHSAQLQDYFENIWKDLLIWFSNALRQPDSHLHQQLQNSVLQMGRQLECSAPIRDWLNQKMQEFVPQILTKYRPAIVLYITERISNWNKHKLVHEVETTLSQDLQFIRINGTLVGGLIGLLIFSLTRWVMG